MQTPYSHTPPMPGIPVHHPSGERSRVKNEKFDVIQTAIAREEEGDQAYDPEKDGVEAPQRQLLLTHAVMVSLAMILVVVVEFACIASMSTDHPHMEYC